MTPAGERSATVEIDALGFVRLTPARGVMVTIDVARSLSERHRAMLDGPAQPTLVDMRDLEGSTPEARRFLAGPDNAELVTRVALLISSPFDRILGNLFVNFSRPPFPTRLFTDEHSAVEWLVDA